MIDHRQNEAVIVDGLQAFLSDKGYNCPVIRSNQTAPVPAYPYLSYTVTSSVVSDTSSFSVSADGTRFKQLSQMWSFTVQSADEDEAMNIALAVYDWFALIGNTYLSDNNITALKVGNITNRDTLLTIEYEYRKGLDVEFLLTHTISKQECETATGVIETAVISHEIND